MAVLSMLCTSHWPVPDIRLGHFCPNSSTASFLWHSSGWDRRRYGVWGTVSEASMSPEAWDGWGSHTGACEGNRNLFTNIHSQGSFCSTPRIRTWQRPRSNWVTACYTLMHRVKPPKIKVHCFFFFFCWRAFYSSAPLWPFVKQIVWACLIATNSSHDASNKSTTEM